MTDLARASTRFYFRLISGCETILLLYLQRIRQLGNYIAFFARLGQEAISGTNRRPLTQRLH